MPIDNPNPNEAIEKNRRPLVSVRELFEKIQKPLAPAAKNVFAEIDKIHYLPEASKIDLLQVNADSFDGEFEYYKMGRGIRIKIRSKAVNKEFALLHEIGHFIDNQILGTSGVNESEKADGELHEVLKAIDNTDLTRKLRQMQKNGKYELMGRTRKLTISQIAGIEYWLSAREKWAKAYSQYIALKAGNELLLKQLDKEIIANELIPNQWRYNDFKTIIFAIDNLLNRIKWSKLN